MNYFETAAGSRNVELIARGLQEIAKQEKTKNEYLKQLTDIAVKQQNNTFEVETPVGTIIVKPFGGDDTPGIAIDFKRKGDEVADAIALINYDDCSESEYGEEHEADMDMRICVWRNNDESYTDIFRLSHLSKPYPTEK